MTELSLYDFKETLVKGIDPDMVDWLTLAEDRCVFYADVGKNGMPDDVIEKLKTRGYKEGDKVCLILDI